MMRLHMYCFLEVSPKGLDMTRHEDFPVVSAVTV